VQVLRELLRATGLQAPALDGDRTGEDGRIDVYLVGPRRMRRLNSMFTGRTGLTDVLAFDYRRSGPSLDLDTEDAMPVAEVFVCPDMALAAAARYRTTVHREILRYIVHGLLHLAGLDDHVPNARRRMRRAERRLLALAERMRLLEELFEVPPRS